MGGEISEIKEGRKEGEKMADKEVEDERLEVRRVKKEGRRIEGDKKGGKGDEKSRGGEKTREGSEKGNRKGKILQTEKKGGQG